MESKHLKHEENLVRKILNQGPQKKLDASHPVLVDEWVHAWNPDENQSKAGSQKFGYIKNPTGTIRWFFPLDTPYPAYLALYNSAHLKARVYKLVTHAAFALNLQRKLFSGEFHIEASEFPLQELMKILDAETYAIFTGTVGENRKSVVAVYRNKYISHFIKLAHTETATDLLDNEQRSLEILGKMPFFRLKHPLVHPQSEPGRLILSNIRPEPARESGRLEDLHLEALGEIYKSTSKKEVLGRTELFANIHKNLERICTREVADPQLQNSTLDELIDALIRIAGQLDKNMPIKTSFVHGDFTPWNMYLSDSHVHIYDWELARNGMPLLYDFFHFVYQSGILLLRQNYALIQREITRGLRLPHAKKIAQQYGLDPEIYHKLYLLSIVSYYLRIYMDEPEVHMQVHWLVDTWNQALQNFS